MLSKVRREDESRVEADLATNRKARNRIPRLQLQTRIMLNLPTLKLISGTYLGFMLTLGATAGSITNNFEAPVDFLADGVRGTMWDGVYFGAGDVSEGTPGVGKTVAANTTTLPVLGGVGYLYVEHTGGGWEGAQNDGFFIYKYVAGDFDVSVQLLGAPFQNVNYHFAGLMARATAFPQGSPFNPTGANAAESFLGITRFQEFNIGDSVRSTSNGVLTATQTFNYPGDNSDTNSDRFLRIVRTGDAFSFYDKTNASDSWSFKTTILRPDLAGAVMQVGIQDAVFTGNQPFSAFTDFELSGPNVVDPAAAGTAPNDPSGVTFSAPNPDGHLTISWTPGVGSSGSLVLLRAATNSLITQVPPYGSAFAGDPSFSGLSNRFGGEGYRLVYAGSGNSVTVSGLGGSNNTYSAAVFSYSGAGAATHYGIHPATGSALGPGNLTNVTFTLIPATIPVGGAASATVHAFYSSGDSYDVSSAPGTVWNSSDPGSALAANGTITGLAAGNAVTITVNYSGVIGSNSVLVHEPAFTDDFSVSHDFVAQGLPGSKWEGLYLRPGDLPGADISGSIMFCPTNDINITSNNLLTVRAGGSDWEGSANDGYFLFKSVPGDFQAMVHITNLQHAAYQFVGLMARASNPDGSAYLGGENHVNWWFFDQFGVITSARSAVNGAVDAFADQTGVTPVNSIWLLLQRINGTNFFCYQKFNANDPWTFMSGATMVQPLFTNGVPLQVGLAQSTFTGAEAELVQFDNFMLDAENIGSTNPPPLAASGLAITSNPDLSITLNWSATNSSGTPVQGMVVMRAGAPVSAQPPYGFLFAGNPVFGQGTALGSGNFVVFRSASPPASAANTVTVTGLNPGVTYYAAVYTFVGSSGTKVFNTAGAPSAGVLNGALQGMQTVLPSGGIPAGGVGTPVVYGVFNGGALVPITQSVSIFSDDPAIIIGTNGVLSGIAAGSTKVRFVYAAYTNELLATVRPPGFVDNFGVAHDYVARGVTGSGWDGAYLSPNSFPNQAGGNDGSVLVCDAHTTSNNTLTVSSTLTDWAGGDNDGFLLFKYVPGDFQAAVHITSLTKTVNYLFAGLMARAYATNGAPSLVGTNYLENWVYLGEFDEFNDDVESRYALDGVDREFPGGPGLDDWWLLMKRENGTHFTFYKRLNPSDPWFPLPSQSFEHPRLAAGVPLQVGLFAAVYTPNIGTVQFDSFMLDNMGGIPLTVNLSGGNLKLRWPTAPGVTLQTSSSLSPANWQTVGAAPSQTGDGYTEVLIPNPVGAAYFRLVR